MSKESKEEPRARRSHEMRTKPKAMKMRPSAKKKRVSNPAHVLLTHRIPAHSTRLSAGRAASKEVMHVMHEARKTSCQCAKTCKV